MRAHGLPCGRVKSHGNNTERIGPDDRCSSCLVLEQDQVSESMHRLRLARPGGDANDTQCSYIRRFDEGPSLSASCIVLLR